MATARSTGLRRCGVMRPGVVARTGGRRSTTVAPSARVTASPRDVHRPDVRAVIEERNARASEVEDALDAFLASAHTAVGGIDTTRAKHAVLPQPPGTDTTT